MNTTTSQSWRPRLLGLAVIAAFLAAIACSVVTAAALVDRYQASGTYLADVHVLGGESTAVARLGEGRAAVVAVSAEDWGPHGRLPILYVGTQP